MSSRGANGAFSSSLKMHPPVTPNPRHRKTRWALQLLVLVALASLAAQYVDLQEFRAAFITPRWSPLVAMVVAGLIFALLGGVNVWIILSALSSIRVGAILPYYFVASSVGNFTPAALGDFSLVGLLRREGVPGQKVLSAMLVDRGVTLALNAVVYVPLTALFILARQELLWVPLTLGLAALIFLALNATAAFRRWILERVVRRLLPQLEQFFRSCSDLLRLHPTHLVANAGVTILRSFTAGAMILFALLAVDSRTGFWGAVVLTNSLGLVVHLPGSPGGVGVYEAGGVALFTQLGLSGARVLAAFVFLRAYRIGISLVFIALARILVSRRPQPGSDDRPSGAGAAI